MRIAICCAIAAIALGGCARSIMPGGAPSQPLPDVSRQILITAKQSQSGAERLRGDPATVYFRRRGYGPAPGVDRLLDDLAADYGLRRVNGWQITSLGVYCEVYELPPNADRSEFLESIQADARIDSVQPMNAFSTQAVRYNDPYAPMQTALEALSLESAHESVTGLGISVAVIDSSVDERHPEIRGRVPVHRNLVEGHREGRRAELHGTAVAGIIASRANNAEGIVGVAPDAEIVSLRACWTVDRNTGRALCSSFSLARALESALRLDVDIVNLSLSGPHDPLLARLIDAAVAEGLIVIAAAPDSEANGYGFPASHPGVIAAVAYAGGGQRQNLLSAPGTEVISTIPGASYGFFSGNSMSAAVIAGATALLLEGNPHLGAADVLAVLAETSTAGSINACLAIVKLGGGTCPPIVPRSSTASLNESSSRR